MPAEAPPLGRGSLPLAAVVLRTARSALGMTAAELAAAAQCAESLVRDIESGDLDPAVDTVERIVNSVGLELRCGPCSEANPAYSRPDGAEATRVASELIEVRAFREQHGLGSLGPPRGTQRDWDGRDPAPPRLFGAGSGRRDGGGWAALLTLSARQELRMTPARFATAAGVEEADVARIESGDLRPPLGQLRRMLTAAGIDLRVRLEVYDDHDDVLHLEALADPDGYERSIRETRATFAKAVVLS